MTPPKHPLWSPVQQPPTDGKKPCPAEGWAGRRDCAGVPAPLSSTGPPEGWLHSTHARTGMSEAEHERGGCAAAAEAARLVALGCAAGRDSGTEYFTDHRLSS